MREDAVMSRGGKHVPQVLIVEDERIVAADIASTLASLGYGVIGIAATAEQAIALASQNVPDIALMDVRIQGALDGIETAAMLRQRFRVPIVFLTAYADEETLARARLVSPAGYLMKPFSESQLRSALEVALHSHRMNVLLERSESWFEATLRSIADAVVTTDDKGRVTFMNSAAETMTGVPLKRARGRRVSDVIHAIDPSSHKAVPSAVRRAIAERREVKSGEGDLLLRTRSGEEQVVEDTAAPILDDDGELLGAVLVVRDVGERKNEEQRAIVAERLASLETLAAGVGHEVNNPLTYVVMSIGLAIRRIDDLRARSTPASPEELAQLGETLQHALTGAERIQTIVADLRNFGAPAAGGYGPVDVRLCVEWAVRMAAAHIEPRARLVRKLEKVAMVPGDEAKVAHVVLNLLMNAAESIAGDAPDTHEITVATRGDAERVVIEVSDTGIGIEPEQLPRIFEPFYTTRPGARAGLGLAVCHGIVKSLDGELRVASEPGRGSTFTVVLKAWRAGDSGRFRTVAET